MQQGKKYISQVISAGAIGTVLEWYDFSLYGYLAPIITKQFFPNENPYVALLFSYAIFALGFIARPIGAIWLGHIGDKWGRKKMLTLSILLMSVATCLLGVLPTYSAIGIFAPIGLALLRLLQGLSASGESVGSIVFVIESSQTEHRGITGALVWTASTVGILMSSIAVFALSSLMSESTFQNYGWRLLFVFGIVTGIVGFYVRRNMVEPPCFEEVISEGKTVQYPVIEAVKKFSPQMLTTGVAYILSATITYLLFVFMPTYANTVVEIPLSHAMLTNSLAMVLLIVLNPTFGWLSDKYGRKIFLTLSAGLFMGTSYFLYEFINQGTVWHLLTAQILFAIMAAAYQGILTTLVLESFPTYVRYSAVVLSYNMAYLLFGGTVPLLMTYLIHDFHSHLAPGYYLSLVALFSFFAISRIHEERRKVVFSSRGTVYYA